MDELRFDLGGGAAVREVRHDDVDALFATSTANQAHLRPWMPWAAHIEREHTQQYVAMGLAQRAREDGAQFVLLVDDEVAGSMGFHRIDWVNRMTSLGYWIAEAHQGKGVISRAVTALVDHAFGRWQLHRVEIDAAVDNVRSRAVPERLGFVEEGVRRHGERFGTEYRDLVVYSMLEPDWRR
ncbi:MAG: GNAT family N-acetyltransferase [Solirubrobacteraceae bacterium]